MTRRGSRRPRRRKGGKIATGLAGVLSVLVGAVLAVAIEASPVGAIVGPENPQGGANAPFAIAVLVNVDAGVFDPQLFCSGALIAPDLVLTAAHCTMGIAPANLHVGAGAENLDRMTLHAVADLIVHPEFDPSEGPTLNPLANDIALLRLNRPITGSTPVRLAPVKDAPMRTPRSNLRVYGWGIDASGASTGWLGRSAQLDVSTTMESPYAELNRNKQILARSRKGSVPCVGDSGGPLVGNRPGKKVPILVGLVSYGSEECTSTMPIVYTRVAGYRDWIRNAGRILRERPPAVGLSERSAQRP